MKYKFLRPTYLYQNLLFWQIWSLHNFEFFPWTDWLTDKPRYMSSLLEPKNERSVWEFEPKKIRIWVVGKCGFWVNRYPTLWVGDLIFRPLDQKYPTYLYYMKGNSLLSSFYIPFPFFPFTPPVIPLFSSFLFPLPNYYSFLTPIYPSSLIPPPFYSIEIMALKP